MHLCVCVRMRVLVSQRALLGSAGLCVNALLMCLACVLSLLSTPVDACCEPCWVDGVFLDALVPIADGFAFASGQAATVTMMHTLKAGDHVVSIDDVYAGTQQYFTCVWPCLVPSCAALLFPTPARVVEDSRGGPTGDRLLTTVLLGDFHIYRVLFWCTPPGCCPLFLLRYFGQHTVVSRPQWASISPFATWPPPARWRRPSFRPPAWFGSRRQPTRP